MDSPISMMSPAEQRNILRHILGGKPKCGAGKKVAEKSALCVTGACSHLPVTSYPVTIKARENRRYGKHLSLGRRCFFFMQDMNGYGG